MKPESLIVPVIPPKSSVLKSPCSVFIISPHTSTKLCIQNCLTFFWECWLVAYFILILTKEVECKSDQLDYCLYYCSQVYVQDECTNAHSCHSKEQNCSPSLHTVSAYIWPWTSDSLNNLLTSRQWQIVLQIRNNAFHIYCFLFLFVCLHREGGFAGDWPVVNGVVKFVKYLCTQINCTALQHYALVFMTTFVQLYAVKPVCTVTVFPGLLSSLSHLHLFLSHSLYMKCITGGNFSYLGEFPVFNNFVN